MSGVVSSDFSSLLNQSLSLASQLPPPTIRRNVAQLQQAASKLQRLHQPSHPFPSTFPSTSLAPSPPLPSSSTSTSAQLFLAQQGVNIGQQQAYLSSLALSTPPPPSSSSPPATSLLAFLQQRHSSLVSDLLHDSVTAVDANLRRTHAAAMDDEWERDKRDILDSIGFRAGKRGLQASSASFTTPNGKAAAPASSASFPSAASPFPASSTSTLSLSQQAYGEVVMALNAHRARRAPFPLVTALRDASARLPSFHSGRTVSSLSHEVTDVFSLLRALINERDVYQLQYQRAPLTEGYYEPQYRASSSALQQQLIRQGMAYCEEVFREHVRVSSGSLEQHVLSAVQAANVGERVREYIGTIPLWPLVFFQLRSGEREKALDTVRTFASSTRAEYGMLLSCMQQQLSGDALPFTGLPSSLQRALSEEYQREFLSRATSLIDPYKLALYSLIGRFTPPTTIDLYAYVADSTESYLWYKLALLDSAQALTALQHTLIRQGEQHFNADGQHPLLFFKVLLLTQNFEYAVAFLAQTACETVAVHAAIALHYYGLLRVCEGDELLVRGEDGQVGVNVGKMLSRAVGELVVEHTELAFHYLYTLYPSSSTLESLSTLLLRSKRSSLLVGTSSTQGLLARYLSLQDLRLVIQRASRLCIERGEVVDGIELLMHGDARGDAADLCARELARLVTADMRDGRRIRLVQLAQQIEQAPPASPHAAPLSTLLSLVQFFDHYHLGPDHYDQALDALIPLHLLPLSPSLPTSEPITLPHLLQRLLGDVSVAVMDVYYHKYTRLGEGGVGGGRATGQREDMRKELRARVHALVDYVTSNASLIGLQVAANLVRLEALMS